MNEIDYYCFPLSPFSYLAGTRLEELAHRHDATITYKPVELMRIFEATGTPAPKDRHESRKSYRLQELSRLSRHLDMLINPQPMYWPANAVPACAAIIAAQNSGDGDTGKLVHSLLRACWAEERNIADDEVIRDCLAHAGFAPDLGEKGMLSAVETLQRNTDEALRRLVFGVPSYVVGEEVFWGQDRLALLDRHLTDLAAG